MPPELPPCDLASFDLRRLLWKCVGQLESSESRHRHRLLVDIVVVSICNASRAETVLVFTSNLLHGPVRYSTIEPGGSSILDVRLFQRYTDLNPVATRRSWPPRPARALIVLSIFGGSTMTQNPDRPPAATSRRNALQSLTALVLIEGLWSRRLLGDDVRPIVDAWFKELVHDQPGRPRAPDQGRRVPAVPGTSLPACRPGRPLEDAGFRSAGSRVSISRRKEPRACRSDFSHVGGLPVKLPFGGQIFAMSKGRSVVPHGHDNMATGFLVVKGNFRGRHYDRLEDHSDHYIIRPTIDREFPTR